MPSPLARLAGSATAALFAAVGLGGCASKSAFAGVRSWAVYYGPPMAVEPLRQADLLVLEPDQRWDVRMLKREGQRVLAYLSIGEIHQTRPYYGGLAAANAVLGPNANWPGAMRVDPGSSAWRHVLYEELAPRLLAEGYDGFFLDTIDSALIAKRPEAAAATATLINGLHARHPQALLVANGGAAVLPAIAPALSGFAIESVFTDYAFDSRRYRARESSQAEAAAARVKEIRRRYGLPVFVLEYASDAGLRRWAAERVRASGFVPFVGTIGLNTPPEAP